LVAVNFFDFAAVQIFFTGLLSLQLDKGTVNKTFLSTVAERPESSPEVQKEVFEDIYYVHT
jgi:hypothetical protein